MSYWADDLTAIFADPSAPGMVDVVLGVERTRGFWDAETDTFEHAAGVGVLGVKQSVVVRTASLTTVETNAAITVDDTAYKIRHWALVPIDSALTRLFLVPA